MSTIKNHYPSIIESWKMLMVIVIINIGFSFIFSQIKNYLGDDISVLLQYLIFMGIPLLYFLKRKKESAGTLELNFKLTNFKISLLLICTTLLLLIIIRYPIIILLNTIDFFKFSAPYQSNVIQEFMPYTLISTCILAPIFEEVIFRGIILNGLLKSYNPLKAIAFSSLLFGLVHLNPIQIVAALTMGIFAGWVYYKTKSIGYTILIHAVNNIAVMGLVSIISHLQKNAIQSLKQYENLFLVVFALLIILFSICLYLLIIELKKIKLNSLIPYSFAQQTNIDLDNKIEN